jgi:hypothetical protein
MEGTMLHDKIINAALLEVVPASGADPSGLYASLLDLAERMLADLDGERPGADAGWTWQVLQVQIPALRAAAGISLEAPPVTSEGSPLAEFERAIRARYGIPAPD